MALTEEQIKTLTWTVLGEAGGESAEGQAAVAHVIKNRSESGRYNKDPARVAKQPKQFSTWNAIGEGGNNPQKYSTSSDRFKRTRAIVEAVFNNAIPDPTGGATHYWAPRGMKGGKDPSWAESETVAGRLKLGNHIFLPRRSVSTPGYTSSREGVQRLQTQLKGMGFDPGKVDGVMGPRTKAAIKEFQTQNGLVADGVVGPRTAAVLSTMGSTGVSGSQNPRNVSGIPVAAPTSTALAAAEQLAGLKPFTSVSNYTASAVTPRPVAGSSGVRDVTSYRPVTPPVTPAAPAATRQYNNMVPSAPVYQKPTGFNPYSFGGVNDVTSSYGRYVPGAPSGSRSSTTQTVRPSGVVTPKVGGASQVGTAAMPTGYRPKLNVIPQSNTYGAGISFPSGLGMSAKPVSRPVSTPNKLTGFGGMTGTSMPAQPVRPAPLSFPPIAPKPNPLTGFGGMTGTYTPPAVAKPTAAPTQSRSTSGGSSSSSGGSPSAGLSTVKLASGTVTTPGTYKSTNGYTYTVRSDGSVYNNTTGRVTAPATR